MLLNLTKWLNSIPAQNSRRRGHAHTASPSVCCWTHTAHDASEHLAASTSSKRMACKSQLRQSKHAAKLRDFFPKISTGSLNHDKTLPRKEGWPNILHQVRDKTYQTTIRVLPENAGTPPNIPDQLETRLQDTDLLVILEIGALNCGC